MAKVVVFKDRVKQGDFEFDLKLLERRNLILGSSGKSDVQIQSKRVPREVLAIIKRSSKITLKSLSDNFVFEGDFGQIEISSPFEVDILNYRILFLLKESESSKKPTRVSLSFSQEEQEKIEKEEAEEASSSASSVKEEPLVFDENSISDLNFEEETKDQSQSLDIDLSFIEEIPGKVNIDEISEKIEEDKGEKTEITGAIDFSVVQDLDEIQSDEDDSPFELSEISGFEVDETNEVFKNEKSISLSIETGLKDEDFEFGEQDETTGLEVNEDKSDSDELTTSGVLEEEGDDLSSGFELDLSEENKEKDEEVTNLLDISKDFVTESINDIPGLNVDPIDVEKIEEGFDFSEKTQSPEDTPESDLSFSEDSNSSFSNPETNDFPTSKTEIVSGFATFELIISGDYAPYDRYVLEEEKVLIGRGTDGIHITLNDPEVSTKHAKVVRDLHGYFLEDLGSSNGTILNGERIKKSTIKDEDEIIIGNTIFSVRMVSEQIGEQRGMLMPIDDEEEVVVEEFVEDPNYEEPKEKKSPFEFFKNQRMPSGGGDQKRLILYGVMAVALYFLLVTDEPGKPKPSSVTKKQEESTQKTVRKKEINPSEKKPAEKKYSKEEREFLESTYQVAKSKFHLGEYADAIVELNSIVDNYGDYKQTIQLLAQAKEALAELENRERQAQLEIQKKEIALKVEKLLEKSKEYLKDRNLKLAEGLLNQIIELDPENVEVASLKYEIDELIKEKERIAEEKAERRKKLQEQTLLLIPAKKLFARGKWYQSILEIEKILKTEDLLPEVISDASNILKDGQRKMKNSIRPLSEEAKDFLEGKDYRTAYDRYQKILNIDPTYVDALNGSAEIKDILLRKSRKIYREGIVYESLTLFKDSKEKYYQVKEISPEGSEYYRKADRRLRGFWD